MRELIDIVSAFEALAGEGKPAALATVIDVEGSAYRRAGARMLIAEDGRTWGGVSGGCLERDVAQRGRGVIASGRPFVIRYDTSDDEQIASGISTGCGGTIDVLIQPITLHDAGPMKYLPRLSRDRRPVTIATVARATGAWQSLEGKSIDLTGHVHDWPAAMLGAAVDQASQRPTGLVRVSEAGAIADVFVETILSPQQLILFGAGPDVVPVLRIAKMLGWHVTVVATNGSHAIADRFNLADVVLMTTADAPLAGVTISIEAAVVVMTHNVSRDGTILAALPVRPRYLGVLGPKHRTDRLIDRAPLLRDGEVFAPVGFDLGAETPEEIAIAIMAEIQATLRRATGQSLRDLDRPIHVPQLTAVTHPRLVDLRSIACPL